MIDALFGSKTRVKLLHLFLSNTGKPFYVREITRLVDEQINSVRRELSNMLKLGIITSTSAHNKLYYEVNQHYEHYDALKQIFNTKNETGKKRRGNTKQDASDVAGLAKEIKKLGDVRVAIAAGTLVPGSASDVDLLLVGSITKQKVEKMIMAIEKREGRELAYTILPYEEFYYRLSVRDKFVSKVLSGKHEVVYDPDNVIH